MHQIYVLLKYDIMLEFGAKELVEMKDVRESMSISSLLVIVEDASTKYLANM
jgi:hypothetical protein